MSASAPRSSSKAMYRHNSTSPAQSSTSLSDNEEDGDDVNKSTFFATVDPVGVSPAQWASPSHFLSTTAPYNTGGVVRSYSLASQLPPELLIHILKHLHSPRDLYHAMLVSRGWCECSVELLWHKPSFTSLNTLGKMMRVLLAPNQSFTYAHFIRRLNFLFLASDLTDSIFTRFAQCVRLERITLVNCNQLSDIVLGNVLSSCPNLVAVDLTGVTATTDHTVVALASNCARLQGINLGGCKKVTNKSILALARSCPLLRRVKLSGVDNLTDTAVSALSKGCPLLLEIDLNGCKKVTDVSVRDLWIHSHHMREMRLSHCVDITDLAFPAPPLVSMENSMASTGVGSSQPVPNPFAHPSSALETLQPLYLSHSHDQLRMLDLTSCPQITDAALAGIIAVAPKIRNLVLAKCNQITDVGIESICKLGKCLHYCHLGHAGNITDKGVKMLARCCTRLRYIDLANCTHLSDMSVFELSTLPKLRRIGLVRVNNLTDEAIYALADRDATLERIHLSYCEHISVIAIHYLLQKLRKLTHLSLTGIPSFRRGELQQFCRPPPQDFTATQRSQFCVYSGKGVSDLRDYLTGLFNTITDGEQVQDLDEDEDDYEGDADVRTVGYNAPDSDDEDEDDVDVDADADADAPADFAPVERRRSEVSSTIAERGRSRRTNSHPNTGENATPTGATMPRQGLFSRPFAAPAPAQVPVPIAGSSRVGGFGHRPIVESSAPTSPAPSEGSSIGNGATFFRAYDRMSPIGAGSALRDGDGALTPDLVFAEIGHGRGMGSATQMNGTNGTSIEDRIAGLNRSIEERLARATAVGGDPRAGYTHGHHASVGYRQDPGYGSARSRTNGASPPVREEPDVERSFQHLNMANGAVNGFGPWSWRNGQASPTSRELHDSIQTALTGRGHGTPSPSNTANPWSPDTVPTHNSHAGRQWPASFTMDDREDDSPERSGPASPGGRERSAKRSFRNTLDNASSFFFGHGHGFGAFSGRGSGSSHQSGSSAGGSVDSGSRGRERR